MMKKALSVLLVLGMAGSVWAGTVNFPAGCTGLWVFPYQSDNGPAKLKATFGADLVTSIPGNSYSYMGNGWTMIGYEPWNHGYYAGNGIVQEAQYDAYLTVDPRFTANGGSQLGYVNQYTVLVDYMQGSLVGLSEGNYYNSLFQTNWNGNTTDGDLFIKGPSYAESVIGVGDTGYSTLTFDASLWHRIVWSVDNGDDTGEGGFFRVYVDGTLFLDAPGQGRDGRFSLYPDRFHLFADDSGEDAWGMVSTAATWNRAFSAEEIALMGGATYAAPETYWTELRMGFPGDANLDGVIGLADGLALADNWGATELNEFEYGSWWAMGDFNGDFKVDAADASILAANIGFVPPPGGAGESAAVPEPSAVAMLVMGALGLLARTRRQAA